MINCIIVCLTLFGSLVYTLHWLRTMSQDQLPHFTLGHLEPKREEASSETHTLGFVAPDEEKELSDLEQRDKVLQDMASTYTAIMRGEFDLDEFGK